MSNVRERMSRNVQAETVVRKATRNRTETNKQKSYGRAHSIEFVVHYRRHMRKIPIDDKNRRATLFLEKYLFIVIFH